MENSPFWHTALCEGLGAALKDAWQTVVVRWEQDMPNLLFEHLAGPTRLLTIRMMQQLLRSISS
jgi:hypothetical protein